MLDSPRWSRVNNFIEYVMITLINNRYKFGNHLTYFFCIKRYSLIPSAETTMSIDTLDMFKDSSKWTAVASDRALLNAPLHKQSCSDHGVRVRARNHSGPVNSSTFHRNKRNVTEPDMMVVNITTCCPFWNFIKRKHTW